MRTKRRARGHCGIAYLLLVSSVLLVAASCAGAPKAADTDTVNEGTPGASGAKPEILEISSPVPLPVRLAILLPDPVPKDSRPSVSSRGLPLAPTSAAPSKSVSPAKPAPGVKPVQSPTPAAGKSASSPAAKAPAASAPAVSKPPADSTVSADTPELSGIVLPLAPASTVLTVPLETAAPTRSEEASRGARVELPFKGSGWVFLGETGGREGLKYDSRRFDGSSALFLFTAEKAGEYVLRFQRQDPLSGDPESLLVKVTVKDPQPAARENAASSDSKTALPPAAAPSPTAAPETAPASPAPASPRVLPSSPEELLRLAREDLAAARIASVLEDLDRYTSLFPFGSDEAFYLYAKAYEQNTPYRDIKKAYACYKQIRDEWPRSRFWKESMERVAYIERHYFEIR